MYLDNLVGRIARTLSDCPYRDPKDLMEEANKILYKCKQEQKVKDYYFSIKEDSDGGKTILTIFAQENDGEQFGIWDLTIA